MEGCCLGIAVDHSNLGGLHLFNQTSDYKVFTAAFGAYKDERLIVI